MRRAALLLPFLLFGCGSAEPASDGPNGTIGENGPCTQQLFEGSRFTVCDPNGGRIELIAAGPDAAPIRRFDDLQRQLGEPAGRAMFAMNAGMFDEEGRPIGLAIVEGQQVHAVNRREGGGNFHLLPNGVFQVRTDGTAEIVPTADWQPSPDIRLATQSGPMLLVDGKLHPRFQEDGTSRYIRNGVGIAPDGRPRFVISEDAVSFGKFARFFRDGIGSRNALFLDGAVSALWDPASYRRDLTVPLGPMIVAFKSEGSTPGRAGRATP